VFTIMSVVAAAHPDADQILAAYGRGFALVLAAIIVLTLHVRPFTEQYARESVPGNTGTRRASTPSTAASAPPGWAR
jgi:hypothetical protein